MTLRKDEHIFKVERLFVICNDILVLHSNEGDTLTLKVRLDF